MLRTNYGFTLIEILVVLFLIGIMATIGVPRFLLDRQPKAEWPAVVDEINNLVIFARQEAISSQVVYRLAFKKQKKGRDFVLVQREGRDPEKPLKKVYNAVSSGYVQTRYELPETIKLHALYHGKDEEFEENKNEGYCYIIPDGLVQDVMIHVTKKKDKKDKKEVQGTLRMAPFFGKFEFSNGFMKPER